MEKQLRIAIVGSRTFSDYDKLKAYIEEVKENNKDLFEGKEINIVSGGARGADTLAEKYAKENGYALITYMADWNKWGKSAGFRRNYDIIQNCDICIAFWDGQSKGTAHDIELCEKYNKQYFICKF